MQQERLFRLAVEAMHLQVTFEGASGWHLSVGYRRQDEEWSDAYRCDYDHLTTPELAQVMVEELSRALGIS